MSGIAGFADLRPGSSIAPGDRARVEAMCDAIRHRGRDDGYEVRAGVALGARWSYGGSGLASNEDGTLSAVVDGEIINSAELLGELEAHGCRVQGRSSAEIVAHAYQTWNDGMFARLRGMFALALWDARSRTLYVARDRAGTKPMYYASTAKRLFFGSEAKCLLANAELDRQIDAAALDHYLAYLVTPRDASIFRHVKKLMPGHYLKLHDGRFTIHRYWHLPIDDEFRGSDQEATDRLEEILSRTIRLHLTSAPFAGTLLSGGVNSSLLAAFMAQAAGGRRLKTFSIAFDEHDRDELGRAKQVAAHLGTDHEEVVVHPDALQILERVIWHFDEPFGDPSALPIWYLADTACTRVPVVFSGDGADELFGGCERYLPSPRIAGFDRVLGRAGRALAGVAWRVMPPAMHGRHFIRHLAQDARGRYVDAMTCYDADERRELLSPDLRSATTDLNAEACFAEPFERLSHLPWTAQMMAFDFETDLPEDVLTKIDRTSMAHSLDWRMPFVDDQLVEFAATLPVSMKIRNRRLKHILRELASTHIPRDIVDRPKQGFGFAIDRWFRNPSASLRTGPSTPLRAGPVRDLLCDVLQSSPAEQRGYFNYRFVNRLLQEQLAGTRDHSMRLWQLLVFELWHRRVVDAPAIVA